MSTTTTRTRVDLEHPYRIAGIIIVILSLFVLAFTLGALERCGGGTGLCIDPTTHAAGDGGLVVFVISFIIGVALIAYTGAAASITSRTPSAPAPRAAPSTVTNVFPQTAVAAPQPAVTNVFPAQATPAPQPSVTYVVSPPASAAPANGGNLQG
ncbi:MAG TPA: hypothetical protein VGP88_07245 [Thermoplasmata archaeon]|jgi:hypothetical protein|nr:hypothetical protein [Thermoplasmata archaeon]